MILQKNQGIDTLVFFIFGADYPHLDEPQERQVRHPS